MDRSSNQQTLPDHLIQPEGPETPPAGNVAPSTAAADSTHSTQEDAGPNGVGQPHNGDGKAKKSSRSKRQGKAPPAAPAAVPVVVDVKPPFEIDIYQIVDDGMMKKNRTDGTGFDWRWADFRRDWMEATPAKYAYRCLPLTILNQTGWWVTNPVGFTAMWDGSTGPRNIDFWFDQDPQFWKVWINNQFGEGIITWNTPFLFRTRPAGSRILVMGPVNQFKGNAHPLSALIESDWISMSFTMNWRLFAPNEKVRFEAGEPLFQVIPIATNVCGDLEEAQVTYRRLIDDPPVHESYQKWHESRKMFHEQKATGEVPAHEWQKDYFQGRDALGNKATKTHMTKVTPPKVTYKGTTKA